MGEKIQLGQIAKDEITGFIGTATARCEHLFGGPQILIEGVESTGTPIERWFNESRLVTAPTV